MSNAWVSVSALVAALAAVGVILFDLGVSLTALAWVAVVGLGALGLVARSAGRLFVRRDFSKTGSFGSERRPSN